MTGPNSPSAIRPRRGDVPIALAVAAGTLALLLATSRDIALAFDEPFTLHREEVLADWFGRVAGGEAREMLGTTALERFWQFSREEPDGHPPFYALLGLAGWRLTRGVLRPLDAYRFGPMVLTAATAGMICLFLTRRHGRLAGVAAGLLFVAAPRVFTHAHYAHYDMPMSCLWLLALMAFIKALSSPRWSLAFGLALGLAMATKFTGWFAVVPALAWAAAAEWPRGVAGLFRLYGGPRRGGRRASLAGTRALVVGGIVALLVLYAIQPPWWREPFHGVRRFLASNLSRRQTVPVSALYLGTVYEFALPWHNAPVISFVTTPVLLQVAAGVGTLACVLRGRSEPSALIWPLSWGVLMVVRALPNAPGHDVERLLLPSLTTLPILAGIGLGWLAERLRGRLRLRWAAPALAAAVLGECIAGVVQMYPYELAYYNVAIGGPQGAERAGFEATYYWETLGPEFLSWARREAAARGHLDLMFGFNLNSLIYLRRWGELPPTVRVRGIDEEVDAPNYVLQRNFGIYAPYDWALDRRGHPVYRIRRGGVDLLRVYSYAESRAAFLGKL